MTIFETRKLAALGLLVVLTSGTLPAMAATDTDGDGVPDAAEPVLGTDPLNADTDGDGAMDLADKDPVNAENSIAQAGKPNSLTFTAKVEDNFDPMTKKDVSDHLELEIKNASGETLTGLAMFYSVKDEGTGKMESYYKPLDGLAIEAGKTVAVNFDDAGMPGHFRDNPNSSYHKSENAKAFTIQLAAGGYAPVQIELKKDKGGAETAD
jgi:hypothetical protein